jgi:hypothetical protein
MNVQTDRALVAAETAAVRYCTVTVAVPASAAVAPRDAELIIRDSRGIRTTCLDDVVVDEDIDGTHVRLGDLPAGRSLTLTLSTVIGARAIGASTEILLRLSDRDRVFYGEPLDVPWRVVDAATNRAQPVNHGVLITVATVMADRARREASDFARLGAAERTRAAVRKAVSKINELDARSRDVNAIANTLEDAFRPSA